MTAAFELSRDLFAHVVFRKVVTCLGRAKCDIEYVQYFGRHQKTSLAGCNVKLIGSG